MAAAPRTDSADHGDTIRAAIKRARSPNTRSSLRLDLFIAEYLKDFNGTRAYKDAGFSDNLGTCGTEACALLKRPDVRARVLASVAERVERCQVSQDDVVRELSRIAFSNPIDMFDFDANGNLIRLKHPDTLSDTQRACIKSVSYDSNGRMKVDFWDKQEALTNLGRHLGMWNDKLKVEGGLTFDGKLTIECDLGQSGRLESDVEDDELSALPQEAIAEADFSSLDEDDGVDGDRL